MPPGRVTCWWGTGWQTWSGVFAAALALRAGERRTALLTGARVLAGGLLKPGLQVLAPFERDRELSLGGGERAGVDALAELALPLGARFGHFRSVPAR
jgi:hypothetical protein